MNPERIQGNDESEPRAAISRKRHPKMSRKNGNPKKRKPKTLRECLCGGFRSRRRPLTISEGKQMIPLFSTGAGQSRRATQGWSSYGGNNWSHYRLTDSHPESHVRTTLNLYGDTYTSTLPAYGDRLQWILSKSLPNPYQILTESLANPYQILTRSLVNPY